MEDEEDRLLGCDVVSLPSMLRLLLTAKSVPSSLILFCPDDGGDTWVLTRATRHCIPEDGILPSHRRGNPKSYMNGWCRSVSRVAALCLEKEPQTPTLSEAGWAPKSVLTLWRRDKMLPPSGVHGYSVGLLTFAYNHGVSFEASLDDRTTQITLLIHMHVLWIQRTSQCRAPHARQCYWPLRPAVSLPLSASSQPFSCGIGIPQESCIDSV
jgi:hypothetical protein